MTPVVRLMRWDGVEFGSVSIDEPLGSITSDQNGKTQVYVFGWYEGQAGVWESEFGAHHDNDAVRAILTMGFTLLSDLAEPYDLTVYKNGQPRPIRFALGSA
jgi:hypothetical protein